MNIDRSRILNAIVVAVALLSGSIPTVARSAPKADAVLDGFAKAVGQSKTLDADARKAVLDQLAESRKDPDRRQTTITETLRETNADFRKAMIALGEEDTTAAVTILKKLAASDDPYLAAEAAFFQARAHMMREDYEAARSPLAKLTSGKLADKTLYGGDALFMQGIAQAGLLDRENATKSLEKFIEENPDASERMIIGALTRIEELKYIKKGSLIDVEDRMDFSRRKLALEDSGDGTQKEQSNVIAMLDKLIKEAEEQEQQGGS